MDCCQFSSVSLSVVASLAMTAVQRPQALTLAELGLLKKEDASIQQHVTTKVFGTLL